MAKRRWRTLVCLLASVWSLSSQTIVILGPSTAEGMGVGNSDSAWAKRYCRHVHCLYPQIRVVNLAKAGYTSYHVMPDNTVFRGKRPQPERQRNITAAFRHDPVAIIVNFATNDIADGYSVDEQLGNYCATVRYAAETTSLVSPQRPVAVRLTTPQPRNLNTQGRHSLMELRDSIHARFGDMTIDFWSDIAQRDGRIRRVYNSGDGTHLNDLGHGVLFERVVAADVWIVG
jgi:lysophospholipase L1-like esterase